MVIFQLHQPIKNIYIILKTIESQTDCIRTNENATFHILHGIDNIIRLMVKTASDFTHENRESRPDL